MLFHVFPDTALEEVNPKTTEVQQGSDVPQNKHSSVEYENVDTGISMYETPTIGDKDEQSAPYADLEGIYSEIKDADV